VGHQQRGADAQEQHQRHPAGKTRHSTDDRPEPIEPFIGGRIHPPPPRDRRRRHESAPKLIFLEIFPSPTFVLARQLPTSPPAKGGILPSTSKPRARASSASETRPSKAPIATASSGTATSSVANRPIARRAGLGGGSSLARSTSSNRKPRRRFCSSRWNS